MHMTAPEEYGLRCMLQVAREGANGSLTIEEISEREGISVANVGKLMAMLRRAGLARSVRGRQGGYRLARPAGAISIAEVMTAMGGDLYRPDFCGRFRGENDACVHTGDCSIRSMWAVLDRLVRQVLERTMLTDLMCSEKSMASWLQERAGAPVRWVGAVPADGAPGKEDV
jgi:Rrf2 family protein